VIKNLILIAFLSSQTTKASAVDEDLISEIGEETV